MNKGITWSNNYHFSTFTTSATKSRKNISKLFNSTSHGLLDHVCVDLLASFYSNLPISNLW